MTTKDKPYIIANQEGVKISQVYEQGFDSTNFAGSYYELNDILSHLNEYDTGEGKVASGSTSLTSTTLGNPTVSKNLIKVGNENINGFFSEKPALQYTKEAYYIPLGTRDSEGFVYQALLTSDKNLNIDVTSGDYQSVASSMYNESFDPDGNYDDDCFYDFEGAHTIASNSIGKNLLKFEEDTSKAKEVITQNLLKGDTISYTSSSYAGDVLSVGITVNGEKYEDFTISSGGTITGNNPLNQDSTVILNLIFHSCFRLKDSSDTQGKKYKNYNLLYYSEKAEDQTTKDNFLRAQDQVSLNNNTGTSVGVFNAPIVIKEEGDYYFSLYGKCEDLYSLNLYGPYFVPKAEFTSIGEFTGKVIPYINNNLTNVTQCNEVSVENIQGYGSYSSVKGSKITPTWKRISNRTHLSPGDYVACFWVARNKDYPGSGLPSQKFMGLKVEKDFLSPYDYRNVNYTNIPNECCGFLSKKPHILYFDFSKASSSITKNSAWTISYLRRFDGLEGEKHLDSIGSTTFGYDGSSIVVNGTTQSLSNKVLNHLNRWERVIINHKANKDTVDIEVISSGDSKLNVPSDSYTLKSVAVSSFSPEMIGLEKLSGGSSTGTYNLLLGGEVSSGGITTYNGSYRSLWFFPLGLSTTEIEALKKQFMACSFIERNGGKELVFRSEFLQEELTY